jgi:signal transduction histidine kinase
VETSAPQVSTHFLELRQGVERYVREARQSILGLRSPALEHLGLEAALKTAGEQLTGGSLIRFEFVSRGEVRPCRPDFQEHLLRIGQEAICNAVRHAHPSLVRAELRYDADDLVLQITDDGDGVDVDAAARAGGLGLQNMRERARAAGGVLDIVPTSGGGTRVEARVPYGHEHAA